MLPPPPCCTAGRLGDEREAGVFCTAGPPQTPMVDDPDGWGLGVSALLKLIRFRTVGGSASVTRL